MKYRKPKYKIGDIVVYENRYLSEENGDVDIEKEYFQSVITWAQCTLYDYDNENPEWLYRTQEIDEEKMDHLEEEEIIEKLN